MPFEKGHAPLPGGGRPLGSENKRTGDFRKAQGELYELFEAELHRDEISEPLAKQTKIQAIVRNIVAKAQAGEQFFMQIMLDRWAGKAIIVAEEKAEAAPVAMVFDIPRPVRSNGHSANVQ
jgi:hypothetical protein